MLDRVFCRKGGLDNSQAIKLIGPHFKLIPPAKLVVGWPLRQIDRLPSISVDENDRQRAAHVPDKTHFPSPS